jgi:hypothetical protein
MVSITGSFQSSIPLGSLARAPEGFRKCGAPHLRFRDEVAPSLDLPQDARSLHHLPKARKQAFAGLAVAPFDDQGNAPRQRYRISRRA